MRLHLYHGRTDPRGGATDIEGNPVDDWGFDGPQLAGVKLLVWTYGNLEFVFKNEEACRAAAEKTQWPDGVREHSLTPQFADDCISAYSAERGRYEYFGDWSLEPSGGRRAPLRR